MDSIRREVIRLMKKVMYVWKESVYKNGFRCDNCNHKFNFDPNTWMLYDGLRKKLGLITWVMCPLCGKPVAYMRPMPKKLEHLPPGTHGDIEDWL